MPGFLQTLPPECQAFPTAVDDSKDSPLYDDFTVYICRTTQNLKLSTKSCDRRTLKQTVSSQLRVCSVCIYPYTVVWKCSVHTYIICDVGFEKKRFQLLQKIIFELHVCVLQDDARFQNKMNFKVAKQLFLDQLMNFLKFTKCTEIDKNTRFTNIQHALLIDLLQSV